MKLLVSISLFFILSQDSWALEINVPVVCYPKFSSAKKIIVIRPNEQGRSDVSEYKKFIQELEKDKEYDWFDCANEISNAIGTKMYQSDIPDETYKDINTDIKSILAHYGAKSYSENKIPAIPQRSLSSDEIRKIQSEIASNICDPRFAYSDVGIHALSNHFLTYGLPFIQNVISENYSKDIHPKCLKNLEPFYAKKLLEVSMTDDQCSKNRERCSRRKKEIQNILSKISLMSGFDSQDLDKVFQFQPDCSPRLGLINEKLKNIELAINQSSSCIPLKEGEVLLVNGEKGSGLNSLYRLKRLTNTHDGKSRYQIDLPIIFRDENKLGLEDFYYNRASFCLRKYQDNFTGPNGEKLTINLKKEKKGQASRVTISKTMMRSNSHKWEPNIDCGTILHELFHLLGLADEYQESSSGVRLNDDGTVEKVKEKADIKEYDCRAIGPKDSLMNNQNKAIESISKGKKATMCLCEDFMLMGTGGWQPAEYEPTGYGRGRASPEEQKALEAHDRKYDLLLQSISLSAKSCPSGAIKKVKTYTQKNIVENPGTRELLTSGTFKNPWLGGGAKKIIKIEDKPMKKSLLYPAHFRYLTKPGCSLENKIYNICARQAYKTSLGAFGSTRCEVGVPDICKEGGEGWLK